MMISPPEVEVYSPLKFKIKRPTSSHKFLVQPVVSPPIRQVEELSNLTYLSSQQILYKDTFNDPQLKTVEEKYTEMNHIPTPVAEAKLAKPDSGIIVEKTGNKRKREDDPKSHTGNDHNRDKKNSLIDSKHDENIPPKTKPTELQSITEKARQLKRKSENFRLNSKNHDLPQDQVEMLYLSFLDGYLNSILLYFKTCSIYESEARDVLDYLKTASQILESIAGMGRFGSADPSGNQQKMLRVALCYQCTAIAEGKRHHIVSKLIRENQQEMITLLSNPNRVVSSDKLSQIEELGKSIIKINDQQEKTIIQSLTAWRKASEIYHKFSYSYKEWDKMMTKLPNLSWNDIISYIQEQMNTIGTRIYTETHL